MAVAFRIHEDLFGFNLDRCEEILFIDAFLRASRGNGTVPPAWHADVERLFFQSDRGVSERLIEAVNSCIRNDEPINLRPTAWTEYMRSRGQTRIVSRQSLRRALLGPERDRLVKAARDDCSWLQPPDHDPLWPESDRTRPPVRLDPETARRRAAVLAHTESKAASTPFDRPQPPATAAGASSGAPATSPMTLAAATAGAAPSAPLASAEPARPVPSTPQAAAEPARGGTIDPTELLLRIAETLERLEAKVDNLAERMDRETEEGMEAVGGLVERINTMAERIGSLEGQSVAGLGAPPRPRATPSVVRDAGSRQIFAPGDPQPDV